MKKKLVMFILTLTAIIGVLVLVGSLSIKQTVFINEVRSWDSAATRNGYFGSDYIELYNASEEAVSLHGWYISDDVTDLKKCQLYDVTLDGKGFALLYANGKNDSGVSLNFKLNSTGEKLFLSNAEGKLMDSVFVPEQEFGTVYARVTDGAEKWSVKAETTNFSNNTAENLPIRNLKSPVFSHESGFYEDAFELILKAEENQTIYYTLDGSEPNEKSMKYDLPIVIENVSAQPNVCNSVKNVVEDWKNYNPSDHPVDKAVIVRAVAMDAKGYCSDVVTHTYFVDEEKYQNKNVISIVASYEDFFGSQGIFVTGEGYDQYYLSNGETEWIAPNFLQSGRRWEIEANIQLFEDGSEIVNQEVGIRTQGASTRLNPKKRMSIFSREEYSGNPYFENLMFDGKKSHAFSLNSSISNVALPELVKDRDVAVQSAMETVVFLNGEYWYDTYALEKYNKYYLEEKYQVGLDNVIIIKNQGVSEGEDHSYEIYGQLLAYAANTDFSIAENYAQLEQMVDIQSYIDYICANVYLCNMDMSEIKNYLLWRTLENEGTEYGDGRWRWMMYDTDCVEWMNWSYYGAKEKAAVNSFAQTMQFTGVAVNEHLLFSSAKNSPKFCEQFVLTFMDMANVNFSLENVKKVYEKWNRSIDIYGKFFENRFDYIVPYLAEEFKLEGTLEEVSLKVNDAAGGRIQLNTTSPDLSKGSWSGKYFTDYPVKVTAIPNEGYEFVGWRGNAVSDSSTIEVEVIQGGMALEAVFEKVSN